MNHKLKNISLIGMGVLAGIGVSLGLNALAQKSVLSNKANQKLPIEDIERINRAYDFINQYYVNSVDDKKLLQGAIKGMLGELDPHSTFFNEKDFKEFLEGTEGRFVGLGIEIAKDKGGPVKVMAVFEESPANRVGLMAGDAIIKVDGSLTGTMTQTEAVKRMRGEPKTKVVITVVRPGVDKPFDLTVTRDVIKMQSVKSKVLENQFGYVRLNQFQVPTFVDLVKNLEQLQKHGSLKGLVLDLRGNPGGSLEVAVGVTSAFLPQPKPLIVYSVGRNGAGRHDYLPSKEYLERESEPGVNNWLALQKVPSQFKNIPMVVLTDCYSASASEIVAGALQDYGRAKVLGIRSYGKGSVQTIFPLDEKQSTGIKLTIATYRTPKGRSLQAQGVVPEYVVPQTPEGDIQHCLYREADLDNHLVINGTEETKTEAADMETPEIQTDGKNLTPERLKELRKYIDYGTADDYQLKQALNLLKGEAVATVKPNDKDNVVAKDKANVVPPSNPPTSPKIKDKAPAKAPTKETPIPAPEKK